MQTIPSPTSQCQTPPIPLHGHQDKRPSRRRRRIGAVLALAAAGVLAGSPRARACICFDPIIFDPANYAENVRQLAEAVRQVATARQAVENGLRMAADWGHSELARIRQAVQRVDGVLGDAGAYRNDPADDLADRYPTGYGEAPSSEGFVALEAAWIEAERDSIVENRRLQNEVAQDVAPGAARIAGLVEASNGAEGETAALQAHTELLAEVSAEVGKVQALKLARARLKVERIARAQSDAAYRKAQRQWVMRDWESSSETQPVSAPFGG